MGIPERPHLMTSDASDVCEYCQAPLQLSKGPNRLRNYRGENGFLVPDDLEFLACFECGQTELMTASQIDQLSKALEAQRDRRNRFHTRNYNELCDRLEDVVPAAKIQDRCRTPDDRIPNAREDGSVPRYAVVLDKGFQAPFILGEANTPEEAIIDALNKWNPPAPRKPSYEELETTMQTREHIDLIRQFLREFAVELLLRGETHDRSKLDRAEVDMFTEFTGRLKNMTYGSDEYKKCLEEMGKEGGPLRHHYDHNRHHPEFYARGLNGMTLVDVFEMYVDWKASVRRHNDGNLAKSIQINKGRFGMSDQLVEIFLNTMRAYP